MHFTSSSHVSGHYGIVRVRILSLLTKVKESVNRQGENKRLGSEELYSTEVSHYEKSENTAQINGLRGPIHWVNS